MRIITTLLLVLLAGMACAAEREWALVTDRDDIKVYRAHTDDSLIKTFRGEAEIALKDFRSIAAIMDDYDFVAEWLHMVSEIRGVSRVSPYDRTVWLTTRLPWPVSDRDVVLNVWQEQDAQSYTLRMPFRNRADVMEEKDGYVRIPRMEGYLEFQPLAPGRIKLTIEVILDPGGYLPTWLANLILRDIPYFSLKRFRSMANDERYQGVDLGYYRIPPGWPGAGEASVSVATPGQARPTGSGR